MDATDMNPNTGSATRNYSSLTVPQLKSLCKDKKLPGYSKLGKAALVQKLNDHALKALASAPTVSSGLVALPTAPSSSPNSALSVSSSKGINKNASITQAIEEPKNLLASTGNVVPQQSGVVLQEPEARQVNRKEHSTLATTHRRTGEPAPGRDGLKRDREGLHQSSEKENTNKRPRTDTSVKNLHQQLISRSSTGLEHQQGIARPEDELRAPNTSSKVNKPSILHSSKAAKQRIRPLLVSIGQKSTSADQLVHDSAGSQHEVYDDHFRSLPELQPISLLSPRLLKAAQKWAVILSGIENDERIACSRVSKTIRYAIYLSAVEVLSRDFRGMRLAKLLQQYPPSTTNFWSYLRARQRDRETQLELFQESFIKTFFGTRSPVAARLWASPDYENQSRIVMRFLLTRVWFSLSVLGDREECSRLFVTDARQVLKDEVWCIDVVTLDDDGRASHSDSFYVLEETCEVIGRPTGSEDSARQLRGVRVDWSDYIQLRLLPSGFHSSPPKSLRSHLKWTNAEEYDMGISKLWLRRIEKEGDLGRYKRKIAERYVLACVVSNSVSGEWMSASRMQQEFAGGATVQDHSANRREKFRVNLFLPSHHLVESVHLTTSGGKNLHKDLAVVQTPAREYYILRDNGMEVGCEEDGVWEVWRNLLACDGRGLAR